MWILPKNYPLSSRFAQDMVESKEDLTLPGLNIESSLMWRSKPSPLRAWSTRWKQGSYLPHLFTRILKPSQRTSFETALTSSLEVIRANPFQQQDSERELMTQDTCGLLLGDTLTQLDLFDASLKTSKGTYPSASEKSLTTWKAQVTAQRGEYSQRLKSAHRIREKESISWLTPRVMEVDESYETYQARMKASENPKNIGKTRPACLTMQVKMQEPTSWATPNTMDHLPQRSEEALVRQATTQRKGRTRPSNLREQVNPTAVAIYQEPQTWATPRTTDAQGAGRPLNEKGQRITLSDPTKIYGGNLSDQVRHWPTVRVSSANGASQKELQAGNPKRRLETEVLLNPWPTPSAHEARLGYQDRSDTTKKGTQESLLTVVVNTAGGRSECPGHLNPEWVEWLMGVPTGWTELGPWEMQ